MRRFLESYFEKSSGFALPSVVIASIVAMTILLAALSSSVSIQSSIQQQYYNRLTREASESGIARAEQCLAENDYKVTWSDLKPLTPQTDCGGNIDPSLPSNLLDSSSVRVSFEVGSPPSMIQSRYQISSTGKVSLLRASDGNVWRSIAYSGNSIVGGHIKFATVAFGYYFGEGAFMGLVKPNGKVSATGLNNWGQLGNGSTNSTLSPTEFVLPAGEKAANIYTNSLSLGRGMFVSTESGKLYGAGLNAYGQLGNNSTSSAQSTPVLFQLPAGNKPTHVALLADTTYVMTDTNKVYAAGSCSKGVLGNGNTSCTYEALPKQVSLPPPNLADLNTIPESTSTGAQDDNLIADRSSVVLRMKGGAVYAWGENDYGQLGDGTTTQRFTPVRVGNFGSSTFTEAKKLAFDGIALYVMDELGDVYATGRNNYGNLAGAAAPIINASTNCLEVPGGSLTNGTLLNTAACNKANKQLFEWTPEGEIRVRSDGLTNRCVDNNGGANGAAVRIMSCNGSSAQKWKNQHTSSGYYRIRSVGSNRCLNRVSNTSIQVADCVDLSATQRWDTGDLSTPTKVPLPVGKKAVNISVDQWSLLVQMDDGTVYAAGDGELGQLGNGTTERTNPALTQMILPSGLTATDIYTTRSGNLANSFVVLSDGSIYGAGSNSYGQLGNGNTSNQSTPQKMNLPSGVTAKTVMSGLGTTVVLTSQGVVYSVGNNSNGQLGNGNTTSSSTPILNKFVNQTPFVVF